MRSKINYRELMAVLISPDRAMADELTASLRESDTFQVAAEMNAYPSRQTLEARLRQIKPEVVLVDVESDRTQACEVVRIVLEFGHSIQVVGIGSQSDSEQLLEALRAGATEFLHRPFDRASQVEAVARLRRLRGPASEITATPGKVIVFSSTKPGSGSSTIAVQTALALKRISGQRVLLADFDLCRGMIGFFLKLSHPASVVEAFEHADRLTPEVWSEFIAQSGGLDVLCAPEAPHPGQLDSARFPLLLEYARTYYDWIIIDLPVVFQRFSMLTLAQADWAFLVTTAELPSLHLARKAIRLLDQLAFPKERVQIVVNRTNKRSDMGNSDIEKIFDRKIHSRIPNDFTSVNRAISLGEPLDGKCDVAKAIDGLASRLSGNPVKPKFNFSSRQDRTVLVAVR
ncbi:MAG: hypothetical protein M3Z32_07500 [Acidobacteriota bacterium]|nr:hypothetical protein [Acidobacteriota bacterium]